MSRQSIVEDFLGRLEVTKGQGEIQKRTDVQSVKVAYDGQTLGRTSDHVHLAVQTGVLAIPSDHIFEVQSLSRSDPSLVRIVVSSPDSVSYVKGGQPLRDDVRGDPDLVMSLSPNQTLLRGRGPVCFPTGCDTATITGGVPDATDDTIVVCCW
jgi:hypothetical protein